MDMPDCRGDYLTRLKFKDLKRDMSWEYVIKIGDKWPMCSSNKNMDKMTKRRIKLSQLYKLVCPYTTMEFHNVRHATTIIS
jgi:hypothetical protein